MALTTSDFVYIWRTCPTMIRLDVSTGGYICLRFTPHEAIPCLEGFTEVNENEHDVKSSSSGVSASLSVGLRCDI